MRNLKFRLSRWEKTLIFEMRATDATFWAKLATVLPSGYYTATNGVRINYNITASDISTFVSTNTVTISTQQNITSALFASDTVRDTKHKLLAAALKEFVLYVNNNGSYTQICANCFNYHKPTPESWCRWIIEVSVNFNATTDKCIHFNELYSADEMYEFYDI
jgi:hypothetical protein